MEENPNIAKRIAQKGLMAAEVARPRGSPAKWSAAKEHSRRAVFRKTAGLPQPRTRHH